MTAHVAPALGDRAPRLRAALGRVATVGGPLAVFLAVIVAWHLATASGRVSRLVLPTPAAVVGAFGHDTVLLAGNGLWTATEAVTGYLIGNAAALLLAILFVHSELGRRAIYPLAMGAQAVPMIAIAPAIILWLGNGMAPKIFVTACLVFFPMLVNALRGLRSADVQVSELLFTLSASDWQRLTMVRLPAALPFVFGALKISACTCFVAAIVSEWIAADHGLGFLIVYAGTNYDTPVLWAAVVIASALSMGLFGIVVLAERLATPWLRERRLPGAGAPAAAGRAAA
jgi:ABC-type nitrate/sulfonate/bicarbonate transport system permease component